jgi:hypothetical protein
VEVIASGSYGASRERLGTFGVAAICAVALLAGCGGRQVDVSPTVSTGAGVAPVLLRLKVPLRRKADHRSSHYISPSTQSVTISVNSATPQIVSITPASPGCTEQVGLASLTCSISIIPPPSVGNDSISILAYDGATGSGNLLSAATDFQFTVLPAQTNLINVTLGGYPAAVQVAPLSDSPYMIGSPGAGYTIYGPQVEHVAVVSYDADNNVIAGLGSPQVTVAAGSAVVSVSRRGGSTSNVWNLTPTALDSATYLDVKVQSLDPNGPTLDQRTPLLLKHRTVFLTDSALSTLNEYQDGSSVPTSSIALGNTPGGVAVDGNGTTAVTFPSADEVSVFNASGSLSYTLGPTANFASTSGVCFDHEGDLYVVSGNAAADAVYEYAPGSQSISAIYSDDLSLPFGCAVGPDDSLWVTDQTEQEVVHYPAGSTTHDFSYPVQLESGGPALTPYAIAVTRSGDVLVGGTLTPTGLVIIDYLAGAPDGSPPSFYDFTGRNATSGDPLGIAVDSSGATYVAINATRGFAGYFPPPLSSASGPSFVSQLFANLTNPGGIAVSPHF